MLQRNQEKRTPKETVQFEHVDPEQLLRNRSRQLQRKNSGALAEVEAEIHVQVVVDMLTHQEEFPQRVVRLNKWDRRAGRFRNPVQERQCREGKTDFHVRGKMIQEESAFSPFVSQSPLQPSSETRSWHRRHPQSFTVTMPKQG